MAWFQDVSELVNMLFVGSHLRTGGVPRGTEAETLLSKNAKECARCLHVMHEYLMTYHKILWCLKHYMIKPRTERPRPAFSQGHVCSHSHMLLRVSKVTWFPTVTCKRDEHSLSHTLSPSCQSESTKASSIICYCLLLIAL
jgi:hypothetical protein